MGTWKTFDVAQASERRPVVDAALSEGGNLFDSSPMYGRAEKVLGELVRGRRDQVLIATKVWTPDDHEAERQVERALGYYDGLVDIYQVHNLVALPARLALLERLRDEGRVRSVGATHYAHSSFPELMQVMRSGRLSMVQVPFSVRDRQVEREVLPLAADLGIGVLVMQPLGTGPLARKPVTGDQLEVLAPFGVQSWSQALLKWILSDPRITCVIPATTSPEHARDNARAGSPPWFGPEERAYVVRLAEDGEG